MDAHRIASREEWLAGRVKLLAREKEFTRQRDRRGAPCPASRSKAVCLRLQ
ncbi:MAG: DUF899 family protein [Alphaproteobacteria bacterium]|nr:DUF899 family protein [Alphaproteobacteria bacterium]